MSDASADEVAWWKRLRKEQKLDFIALYGGMVSAGSAPFGFVTDAQGQVKTYALGALPEGKSAQPFRRWCYRI